MCLIANLVVMPYYLNALEFIGMYSMTSTMCLILYLFTLNCLGSFIQDVFEVSVVFIFKHS